MTDIESDNFASKQDLEDGRQKPVTNKFLEELEQENAILEEELAQLMRLQDQKELKSIDMARFSFGDSKNILELCKGAQLDDDEQTEVLREENTKMVQFEPHKLITEENIKGSAKFPMQNKKRPLSFRGEVVSQNLDCHAYRSSEKQNKEIVQKENYDQMLDTLMNSITNIVQDKQTSQRCDLIKPLDSHRNSSNKEKQIKSLEMRLSGSREALKNAEKELKDKDKLIQQLQQELSKKNKSAENSQGNQFSKENFDLSNKMSILDTVTELKKREKIYDKKLLEGEIVNKENKKYMIRLQELNQSLLAKVKQYEGEYKIVEQMKNDFTQSQVQDRQKFNIEERKNKQIKDLEDTLAKIQYEKQDIEEQLYNLKVTSDDYLNKTTDLKENYNWLIERLEKLSQ